jgi:hypothetical protein
MTEVAHLPRLPSAAERMRLYRERRRRGLSCIKVQLRRSEVDALSACGLLQPVERQDRNAFGQRSIGISMQTLLRDADRDAQRQKWDASSARPGGKREPVLAGVIPFRKTRNPVSTSEEVMRSCPTVTSAVRRQQGDSNM